ncbi:MAG: polysaccharide biosynthesis C-terminal domain-containing protein, partial [Desulfuromusa sp.]|nr:polysaccharide biosynthesis C-terminal domain-containing protein [Desulfuromusa sp.]
VPILKVLCIGGILWPLHVINLNILMAQGHSKLFFKLEIIKKTLGTVLLIAGSLFGVLGIAWSTVVFGGLGFIINAHYTEKHLEYGTLQQILDILPTLGVALIMVVTLSWVEAIVTWSYLPKLLFLIVVGVCIFLAGCLAFRVSALYETLAFLRTRQLTQESENQL